MKYKYCHRCRKAYIRSYAERDVCIYCNTECEVVEVRRNAKYIFGYGLLVLGAVSVLIPRFIAVADRNPFIYFGIGLAIAGCIMVVMGSMGMAKSVAESFEGQEEK